MTLASFAQSGAQVLVFERLTTDYLRSILVRAAGLYQLDLNSIFEPIALEVFLTSVSGDARQMLNTFETILRLYLARKSSSISDGLTFPFSVEGMEQLRIASSIRYDKKGDEHYDTISAFIKSVRGSDPDAAIYYLARMLEGGEDPVFLARRLVILASEDIGNADPEGSSACHCGVTGC